MQPSLIDAAVVCSDDNDYDKFNIVFSPLPSVWEDDVSIVETFVLCDIRCAWREYGISLILSTKFLLSAYYHLQNY